jgi:hypothetical protein
VKTGAGQARDERVKILDYAGWQTLLLQFVEIQTLAGSSPSSGKNQSPGLAAGFRIVA